MAELVSAVETVRRGREMHTTTVRNEHAYYCCIAQLMSVPDLLAESNKCSGFDEQDDTDARAGAKEMRKEGRGKAAAVPAGKPNAHSDKPIYIFRPSLHNIKTRVGIAKVSVNFLIISR